MVGPLFAGGPFVSNVRLHNVSGLSSGPADGPSPASDIGPGLPVRWSSPVFFGATPFRTPPQPECEIEVFASGLARGMTGIGQSIRAAVAALSISTLPTLRCFGRFTIIGNYAVGFAGSSRRSSEPTASSQ
jgi:hypothetical protein